MRVTARVLDDVGPTGALPPFKDGVRSTCALPHTMQGYRGAHRYPSPCKDDVGSTGALPHTTQRWRRVYRRLTSNHAKIASGLPVPYLTPCKDHGRQLVAFTERACIATSHHILIIIRIKCTAVATRVCIAMAQHTPTPTPTPTCKR